MNSLTILQALLEDASVSTGADVKRDLVTIKSRLEHEGESFLSITLPQFGSSLLASLDSGCIVPEVFHSFKRKRKGGKGLAVPCFLHGLVVRVFDEETGNVLENEDIVAINFLWQICRLYAKEKRPCSLERESKAFSSYIDADLSLRKKVIPTSPIFGLVTRRIIRELGSRYDTLSHKEVASLIATQPVWSSLNVDLQRDLFISKHFQSRDSSVLVSGLPKPKHGPGATADRLKGNQKFTCRDWYSRWNGIFSWEELYGFSTISQTDTRPVSPDLELPVKVISVPKTQKTPRIISVEPTAMQYAQQLVSSRLTRALLQSSFAKQVNILDQRTNAKLALEGSLTREWATLDLSEASDRVSAKLVRDIFRSEVRILKELMATRSTKALMDDGALISLSKFASMGSACTFPVETIVFYVIAVSAVAQWRWDHIVSGNGDPCGTQLRALHSVCEDSLRLAFVYGDDIIVPSGSFSSVASSLEGKNLKVNRKKSFSQGAFRESCGMDAYKGVEITPVYVRSALPTTIKDATEVGSWVSFANQCYARGLWKLARHVREGLNLLNGFPFPHVLATSPGLGWNSFQRTYSVNAWDKTLMRPKVRTRVLTVSKYSDEIDGEDALLKYLVLANGVPSESSDHLARSVRRNSNTLRLRMVTPY
jgi:hypothetical protein